MKLHVSAAATLIASAVAQKVVETKFHKIQLPPELIQITRRDMPDLAAINNITGGGYYSEFEVGTPGQKVLVMLDTGSSDTWVLSSRANLCNSVTLQSQYGGCTNTFNSSLSSTFKMVDANGFDITYLDGRNIKGSYVTDSVSFDGKTITNQQLGFATRTVRGTGLMGLGFSENVATSKRYPTILDSMVSQGYISRKVFSLYLNDLQASEGTLLFGGVDTEKYIGKLVTVPLVPDLHSKNFTSYSVAMTSVTVEMPNGNTKVLTDTTFNASTVLDSGSTLSLLPPLLTAQLWKMFNVRENGFGFVDCKYAGPDGYGTFFDFQFQGVRIRVPLEEMILDILGALKEEISVLLPFSDVCLFGIQSTATFGVPGPDFALLGDTFLRSAYVVYDETNRQVGIAQANLNSTKSNIIELSASDTALPTVTGVASQVTLSPTQTSSRGNSGGGATTPTSGTQTPSQTPNGASRQGVLLGGADFGLASIASILGIVGGLGMMF